jgi:hypothetical protein
LSCKVVEKLSPGRSKVADDARTGGKAAETKSKYFCAAGFDALVKQWDTCISVSGRYVAK